MEITKIKINRDEGLDIHYAEYKTHATIEAQYLGKGEPHEKLSLALQNLLKDAVEFIGLDEENYENRHVIGIAIKHTEKGIGCVITVKNQINTDIPVSCSNTPYISPEKLPPTLDDKISILMAEAEAYIDGARKPQPRQQSIPGLEIV
jgi:hypothetical protein